MQCVAVCCSELQCDAASCSVLQRVAVCCSVMQCVAVCCSMLRSKGIDIWKWCNLDTPILFGVVTTHMLHRVAGCSSVLQCRAVCCSALQCAADQRALICEYNLFRMQDFYWEWWAPIGYRVLQSSAYVAMHCSVLQRVAVCCSVLQIEERWCILITYLGCTMSQYMAGSFAHTHTHTQHKRTHTHTHTHTLTHIRIHTHASTHSRTYTDQVSCPRHVIAGVMLLPAIKK